ncbi:class I SAM-dependent methyltransferase [Bremerella sp. P1]|uniref:class I SAM-dependent methyltransferase n=1 Tax=Bremerella sp. P1 TaxID=3026424 RepID=UPI0023685D93|nr:class I SAM-dependent methyltransferase [Bremerella sp. P1]WDI40193.1 class I SAM-dependent methyltransferase [Bremerella sp. P1]
MPSINTDNLDVNSGHQVYTPKLLRWYDLIVHGVSNRWFWSCPTQLLEAWFDDHATNNHLDIGVGTGFFLDRCSVFSPDARIGLLDANPNCLAAAAKRIERYHPETIQANLAEPFEQLTEPFTSVSLMYVLHCLPGDQAFRKRVIEHASAVLTKDGKLFGATLLGKPSPTSWLGRQVMASYNRKGIFGNEQDTLESLKEVLETSLVDIEIQQVGSVALFVGRNS